MKWEKKLTFFVEEMHSQPNLCPLRTSANENLREDYKMSSLVPELNWYKTFFYASKHLASV